MTQLGEGIHIALARLEDNDKCIFCGKKHDKPKRNEVKPTGWKREQISGVGGDSVSKKRELYPKGKAPPSKYYRSEGHHCLAFSAFIVDARTNPKDRFAALNHYLKEKDYNPNNENNRIDLPGRKKKGEKKEAHYYEFEKAVVAGFPLQLHIGGHSHEFLGKSNFMLRNIVNGCSDRGICSKDVDAMKQKFFERIRACENKAFKLTAAAKSGWIAHPAQIKKAECFVLDRNPQITEIKYPELEV